METIGLIIRVIVTLLVLGGGFETRYRKFDEMYAFIDIDELRTMLGQDPDSWDSIDVAVPRNWRKAVTRVRQANGAFVTATATATPMAPPRVRSIVNTALACPRSRPGTPTRAALLSEL